MRLSKTSWLILGIGIFVIVFGGLYMVYDRERGELEQLEASLSVARAALPGAVSEKEARESQLAQLEGRLTLSESELVQAESLLHKAAAAFPRPRHGIDYAEALFALANEHDLEIPSLTPSRPAHKEIEGVTFSATSFSLAVVGKEADILNFIGTIAAGGADFAGVTLKSVAITPAGASITLAVYGYQ